MMNGFGLRSIALCLAMLFPVILISEESKPEETVLYFDIVAFNRVVGKLTTIKSVEGSGIFYKSTTAVNIRIIKNINVVFDFEVSFSKDEMQCADIKASVNDDVYADTHTERVENNYRVYKNGERQDDVMGPIYFSAIRLYFEEPVDKKRCYAEQQGSFNTIEPMGNHSYKMTNVKGMENLYYYESGQLKRGVIDAGLIDFEIVASKSP